MPDLCGAWCIKKMEETKPFILLPGAFQHGGFDPRGPQVGSHWRATFLASGGRWKMFFQWQHCEADSWDLLGCFFHFFRQVGRFISHLCNSSESSLQMLVACGGLEAIVELISSDYFHNPDLEPWLRKERFGKAWIAGTTKYANLMFKASNSSTYLYS